MFQYLEKLRRKPEGERRKAVLLISLCITIAIALIWLATVMFRLDRTDFSFTGKAPDREMPSLRETFSNFFDQVSDIVDNDATYESATNTDDVNY